MELSLLMTSWGLDPILYQRNPDDIEALFNTCKVCNRKFTANGIAFSQHTCSISQPKPITGIQIPQAMLQDPNPPMQPIRTPGPVQLRQPVQLPQQEEDKDTGTVYRQDDAFMCGVCGKRFGYFKGCKNHIARVHGLKNQRLKEWDGGNWEMDEWVLAPRQRPEVEDTPRKIMRTDQSV